MSDDTSEHELSQDQIDESLSDQGFSAEVGTERWVSDLNSVKLFWYDVDRRFYERTGDN